MITLQSRRRRGIAQSEWDSFAEQCGASHHCAFDHIGLWHLLGRVHYIEIFEAPGEARRKIGQCAVAEVHGIRRFLDGLQLLPDAGDMWAPVMSAVLEELGSGHYRYGSNWSLECPRDLDLLDLPGVAVQRADPVVVQAVDFSRWATWDDYAKSMSENVRRNANNARKSHPDLRVTEREGLSTVTKVQALIWFRAAMCRRKGLQFRIGHEWLRALVRAVVWRRHVVIASAEAHRRALAMFSGIRFGTSCYYLEGASRPDNSGASWHLMMTMLKSAYRRSPRGKFVMGVVEKDPNLNRSRQQCRVSNYPGCLVEFNYAGPVAAQPAPAHQKLRRKVAVPV
jgi:hypothetical protein